MSRLPIKWLSTFHPLPKPSATRGGMRGQQAGQKRSSEPGPNSPDLASATSTPALVAGVVVAGSSGGQFDPTQCACARTVLLTSLTQQHRHKGQLLYSDLNVSQYSNKITDWTTGVQVPIGARTLSLFHSVQTGSGAHPASYSMGTGGKTVEA
jgi:hypothetical protein